MGRQNDYSKAELYPTLLLLLILFDKVTLFALLLIFNEL
jgi:hypothetical protein